MKRFVMRGLLLGVIAIASQGAVDVDTDLISEGGSVGASHFTTGCTTGCGQLSGHATAQGAGEDGCDDNSTGPGDRNCYTMIECEVSEEYFTSASTVLDDPIMLHYDDDTITCMPLR